MVQAYRAYAGHASDMHVYMYQLPCMHASPTYHNTFHMTASYAVN